MSADLCALENPAIVAGFGGLGATSGLGAENANHEIGRAIETATVHANRLSSPRPTVLHTDRQASVVAITDAAGNVVSRRGYGSYGETDGTQLVGTGSHPFGYTGRRWGPDLGIYYYRARWYDPTTGTFLQTDPIGSLDYINLYAYVGLEPGNKTDPTGMMGGS